MVEGFQTTLKYFASQGHLTKAFRIFRIIQHHALASASCDFVEDSLSCLLFSCTERKLVIEGKQLHAQVITWGLQHNHVLVPKLVSHYAAFNSLDDAHLVATNTSSQNPLQWNVLISSYVKRGHFEEAILAYKHMCQKQIKPDNFTYPTILKACAELSNLDFGKEVHMSIDASSLSTDLFVQNALISMYGKCGDLDTARSIFNGMLIKDEISWNSMISEYASKDMWNEAFMLFESMQEAGIQSNVITWNTIAGGCLRTGNFKGALELVGQMRVSLCHLDPVALIIALGASSHLCSLKLGKEIHGLAVRNSSIDYVNLKNALITLYSRCGDLTHAYTIFRSIEAKSIISWNSIISGFAQWDRSEEATFLFRELFHMDFKPNYVTLAGILPLCARVANLKHGKELHCYIAKRAEFWGCLLLWNSLIDTYARSGKVLVARRLFDLLDERDAVTYTSMISGYGVQGDGKVALNLFEEMIRSHIKPDAVAMVSVLSACSHSGLVNHGQSLFEKMQTVYGISPKLEHFSCMVDLYGRAGLLNKATEILLSMPCKPTPELWATLIGACLVHGNKDIGEWAAGKLLELKPQHSGHYVLIANMYAAAGCWSKLVEVRSFMRDLGVRKEPGCAWVDIGAGVSPFLVDDTSNSQSAEIFLLLRGLTKQMKDVDYAACTDYAADKEIIHGNDYS